MIIASALGKEKSFGVMMSGYGLASLSLLLTATFADYAGEQTVSGTGDQSATGAQK
jgi:hypothetical protein